jgi:hypothetical protein
VFTFVNGSSSDLASSVTYDGVGLTAVTSGRAVDTAGELGDCKAWFLGSGVNDGSVTVRVNRTNNSVEMYAIAVTVDAGVDTDDQGVVVVEENGTWVEQSVDDGSPGSSSQRYAATFAGRANIPATGTNSTTLTGIDFGSTTASAVRETTPGQGSRLVGYTQSPGDDRAYVSIAVREP